MKSPPKQFTDDEAREMTEEYISAETAAGEPKLKSDGKPVPSKTVPQKNGGRS
jgi:hypothetical protein